MYRKLGICFLVGFFFFGCISTSQAETTEELLGQLIQEVQGLKQENVELRSRLQKIELHYSGDDEKPVSAISTAGPISERLKRVESLQDNVRWSGEFNAVMAQTLGDYNDNASYGVSAHLYADGHLSDSLAWFAHFEYNRTDSADRTINSISGLSGDIHHNTVGLGVDGDVAVLDVMELWLEETVDLPWNGSQLIVTGGKINSTNYTDTNAYANDENSQFISAPFVNNAAYSRYEFTPGIRATLTNILPEDWRDTIRGDFTFVGESRDDSGANIFSDPFLVASLDLYAYIFNGRETHLNLYGWNTGNSPGTPKHQNNWLGFGLSFDQEITDKIGVFARYAMNEKKKDGMNSPFPHQSFSLGTQILDPFDINEGDALGAAYGWVNVYRDGTIDATRYLPEHLVEIYYKHQFDGIAITPFVQIIANGSADRNNAANAAILGARAHAEF